MWHRPTRRLIEKDPSKRAGKWKIESGIFFMWADKIIDSKGVSKQAGRSYEAPAQPQSTLNYVAPKPESGTLQKIDISGAEINGHRDKSHEGLRHLLRNTTGAHDKWCHYHNLCYSNQVRAWFKVKLTDKNHIRAFGLKTANDCPYRDPKKFDVYAKPFPEDPCPAQRAGDFDIEPGFYLIC